MRTAYVTAIVFCLTTFGSSCKSDSQHMLATDSESEVDPQTDPAINSTQEGQNFSSDSKKPLNPDDPANFLGRKDGEIVSLSAPRARQPLSPQMAAALVDFLKSYHKTSAMMQTLTERGYKFEVAARMVAENRDSEFISVFDVVYRYVKDDHQAPQTKPLPDTKPEGNSNIKPTEKRALEFKAIALTCRFHFDRKIQSADDFGDVQITHQQIKKTIIP